MDEDLDQEVDHDLDQDIYQDLSESFSIHLIQRFTLKGNDVEIEGFYVMEDGQEMSWMSHWAWNYMDGDDEDGIILSTHNDAYAGSWCDTSVNTKSVST